MTGSSGILLDGTLGGNTVEGNFLGTDVTGTTAAANQYGVSSQSPGNLIGGTSLASRNLISGNSNQGARALAATSGSGATTVVLNAGSGTRFKNNLIGTRATGMTGLANGGGISLSVPDVIIGGTSAAERNIISGNSGTGIQAFASVSSGTFVSAPTGLTVQGNYIGTTVTGLAALPNTSGGITASGDTTIIGGDNPTPLTGCTGACNLISGNAGNGLSLNNSYDNSQTSPTAGTRYSTAASSVVEGNYIGVNVTGTLALGNSGGGVQLSAADIRVGGGSPATRNVISGQILNSNSGINAGSSTFVNTTTGAYVVVGTATGSVIRGNYIGLNAAGTAAIPNHNGISVSVPGVRVGGTDPTDRNVVSGNNQTGINSFVGLARPQQGAPIQFSISVMTVPSEMIVEGNYVGVSANGSVAVPNLGGGVRISGINSRVGGTVGTSALSCTGPCNLISGNTNPDPTRATGVTVSSDHNNATLQANIRIYSDASGSQVVGNFIGVVRTAHGTNLGGRRSPTT